MPLGLERWCELLKPWRTQIRCATSDDRTVTFDVDSLELNAAGWRRFFVLARETAELLHVRSLVESCMYPAHADMLMALERTMDPRLVGFLPPYVICRGGPPAPTLPPGLVLKCTAHRLKESDAAMFAAFFFAFDAHSVRSTFRRTMQEIYAALTPAERRRVDAPENRLPVTFTFTLRQGEQRVPVAEYLRAAAAVVRRAAALASAPLAAPPRESDSQWRCRFPFTLQRVGVAGINGCSPRERGLSTALAELLGLGVQFDGAVDFATDAWAARAPVAELGPVLQGLTDAGSLRATLGIEQVVPDDTSEVGRSLAFHTHLAFTRRRMDDRAYQQQLEALFSSFLTMQDVRRVNLSLAGVERVPESGQRMLKWLVYALFSKDAAACVFDLGLDVGRFAENFADAITSVLAATNPASALLGSPASRVGGARRQGRQRGGASSAVARATGSLPATDLDGGGGDDCDLGFARLDAGTSIRIKPVDESSGVVETFQLKRSGRFRVLQDVEGDDWVDIVVPCFGHCRVDRRAIDSVEHDATPVSSLSAGYRGSVISLRFGDSCASSVLPLVRFVGSKLQSLHVGKLTTNADLCEILASCPELTDIVLPRTEKAAAAVLIEAFERGQCKLERLHIDAFWEDADTQSTDLIRVLQDPASVAAKRLQELNFIDASRAPFSNEFLDALVDMLAANRTLSHIRLCAWPDLLQPRLPALMETNGRWVTGRPLCMASRYAFLSVLQHLRSASASEPPRKRSRPSRAISGADVGRLDPAVLANVFEFAAEGAVRTLEIGLRYY